GRRERSGRPGDGHRVALYGRCRPHRLPPPRPAAGLLIRGGHGFRLAEVEVMSSASGTHDLGLGRAEPMTSPTTGAPAAPREPPACDQGFLGGRPGPYARPS